MSYEIADSYKQKLKSYLAKHDTHEEIVNNIAQGVLDLSGAAQTLYLLCAKDDIMINWILLVYQEASSADAGVAIEIGYVALSGYATGRTTDRDEFLVEDSEVSKAQWYGKLYSWGDLLLHELRKGEILTVFNTGGKTGTGALYVFVGYTIQK